MINEFRNIFKLAWKKYFEIFQDILVNCYISIHVSLKCSIFSENPQNNPHQNDSNGSLLSFRYIVIFFIWFCSHFYFKSNNVVFKRFWKCLGALGRSYFLNVICQLIRSKLVKIIFNVTIVVKRIQEYGQRTYTQHMYE